jgi:amidohydrolase
MEYRSFIDAATKLAESLRAWRRDFHRHPELGFQEHRTAGIVTEHLQSLGLETRTGVAETGVMALIEGDTAGPVILIRFDMDALPIQEETQAEYASKVPGVMHACGHDGHTSIGMAVAEMLVAVREDLPGTVKLVFQPAEEGLGGAERMVEEGVLQEPKPDFALGLHLWNDKPFGWIGVTEGPAMAGSEIFEIEILGKGGHGASPHQTTDPVFAAAQVVTALQSIVSRNVDPLKEAVLSVTWLEAGDAFNVIPERARLRGTIRSYDPDIRELVLDRMAQITEGIVIALGCTAKIQITKLTPTVNNDLTMAQRIQGLIGTLLPGMEISTEERTMGSEDMAFFMEDTPGCYLFIGSKNDEQGLNAPHHNPGFDFDEEALALGAGLITSAAWSFLKDPV